MTAATARVLEREHSYHLFFESNPLPMWIYETATLSFVAVNAAAISQYGYSKSEFLQMQLADIRPSADVQRMLARRTADRPEQIVQKGTWTHVRKSGEQILVDVITCRIGFGGMDCKLALLNDITERERAHAALVEWKNRYQAAIQASGQTLYDWDLSSGKITYHGDLAEKLGYSCGELESGLGELVHGDDRAEFKEKLDYAIRNESRFAFDYRVFKKDGSYIWVEDVGHWVKDRTGKVVRLIGFIQDVSQRKNLEAQLRQSQKMDALGRLAAGVAHDFNNLLGVILGYSELLMEESLSETAVIRAQAIRQAGERGSALTRQLLVFSRQEVVRPKVLDVNAILQNMESMLVRMIGEDVNLCMITKSQWAVKVDPGQIEQVLMNLVINARDAMPDGGMVTVESADVYLDDSYTDLHPAVSPGPYVQVTVSDTGMGMDSETRARIFEPFFTTKSRGTGLGLATVYGIVKQCSGSLSVYSEPGQAAVSLCSGNRTTREMRRSNHGCLP